MELVSLPGARSDVWKHFVYRVDSLYQIKKEKFCLVIMQINIVVIQPNLIRISTHILK